MVLSNSERQRRYADKRKTKNESARYLAQRWRDEVGKRLEKRAFCDDNERMTLEEMREPDAETLRELERRLQNALTEIIIERLDAEYQRGRARGRFC